MIAVAKGEEELPEEVMVVEADETRDELDAMREVVEEAKVDEPIVEFWQAASAAKPNVLDKIEALILMITASQGGVRTNERNGDRVVNCLGEKISTKGNAFVIFYIGRAYTKLNISPFGIAELQLIGSSA